MVMLTTIGNRDDIILRIIQSYLKKYAMLDISIIHIFDVKNKLNFYKILTV